MGFALEILGYVVYLPFMVWLCYQAWTNEKPVLAVLIFCLGPIGAIIYVVQNWDEGKIPFIGMMVGVGLRIAGAAMGAK